MTIEDVADSAVINWHQDFDNAEVARNMAHIAKPANEQVLENFRLLKAANNLLRTAPKSGTTELWFIKF